VDAQSIPKTEPLLRQLVACGLSAPKLRLPHVETSLSDSTAAGQRLDDHAKPGSDAGDVGDIRAFPGLQSTENRLDSHCSAGADKGIYSERGLLAHSQDLVSFFVIHLLHRTACFHDLNKWPEMIDHAALLKFC
jgi:hypothetical protein